MQLEHSGNLHVAGLPDTADEDSVRQMLCTSQLRCDVCKQAHSQAAVRSIWHRGVGQGWAPGARLELGLGPLCLSPGRGDTTKRGCSDLWLRARALCCARRHGHVLPCRTAQEVSEPGDGLVPSSECMSTYSLKLLAGWHPFVGQICRRWSHWLPASWQLVGVDVALL